VARGLVVQSVDGRVVMTEREAVKGIQMLFNKDNDAEPTPRRRIPKWCHEEGEEPPADFKFGPLRGTQEQLALWLGGKNRRDGRLLQAKARNRIVWVRMFHKRSYEAWFRSETNYAYANRNRLVEEGGR